MKTKDNIKNDGFSYGNLFKKILVGSCICYTVLTVLIISLQLIVEGNADDVIITPIRFLLILPFSFLASFGISFLTLVKIRFWIRILCHYLVTVIGYFTLMYIPSAINADDSQQLQMFFILTLIYLVAFVIIMLIRAAIKRHRTDKIKYDSVFKK